jgi:hypothetical protein
LPLQKNESGDASPHSKKCPDDCTSAAAALF